VATALLLQMCNSLYESSLGTMIRESDNVFSAIETAHVLGITLVAGTIAVGDLRILGVALRDAPIMDVIEPIVRITWIGFLLMLSSGALLFCAEAAKLYGNGAFRIKLSLLVAAAANAWLFHAKAYRHAASWGAAHGPPLEARAFAACSLALWSAIVVFGRAIAYG
jgi:hypothetical protein